MAMQMQRAFNKRMLSKLYRFRQLPGSYNADNDWVDGEIEKKTFFGVIKAGNKFSQFEEGISIHNTDGGVRLSDYRALYVIDKYEMSIGDKVQFKDTYYNILQKSDESVFGFSSYIIEKVENWNP